MEKGLKYGLLAAAAGLGIYSIIKANQDEEPALPAPAQTGAILSYGDWREITQTNKEIDYWNLSTPPEVPGKTLVNWFVQWDVPEWYPNLAASAYCINGNHFGALIMPGELPFTGSFRIVAIYI